MGIPPKSELLEAEEMLDHFEERKVVLFEGGIRVPSIVSLPGVIPSNEVRSELATGCDWYPTIAELCGLALPGHHLDGKSLVPMIQSSEQTSPHEQFFWLLGRGERAQWAVRQGDWKYSVIPLIGLKQQAR